MSEEAKKQKQIEKPWAVYLLAPSIVKVVQDEKEGLAIQDSESQSYPPMPLSHKDLIRFDTSYDAIEYFCKHYFCPKEEVVQTVLSKFSSEKANLETLLAQSQPKFTEPTPFRRIDAMELGYSEAND